MRNAQKLVALAGYLLTATAWGAPPAHTCVTSGSGPTYIKVCISKQGNVVKFESPQGKDHIRGGNKWGILEGYSISWDDFDGGYRDATCQVGGGGWCDYPALPYKIEQPNGANTFPLRIYTRPGGWEVKQEFNRDTTERELTITMTWTNRSGEPYHYVYFSRLASFGIDNDYGDDNVWSGGPDGVSVIAWEGTGVGNAVAMTSPYHSSPVADHNSVWYSGFNGPEEDPFTLWQPSGGGPNPEPFGVVGGLTYIHGSTNFPNGASFTAKFVYRAF